MYPRIVLNDVTIRHAPFAQRFAIARQAGFTGVELWMDEVRQYAESHGGMESVCNLLRDNDLRLEQVLLLADALSVKHAQDRRHYLQYAKTFFIDAQRLGATRVLTCATFGKTDVEAAAGLFAELCDLAKEYGIGLSLEFVGWAETIKDIKTARAIVEKAGRPNGGILYDTFHHYFGGSSLQDLEELPVGLISAVHIVDANKMALSTLEISRKHRVFPGKGMIPVLELLGVLRARQVDSFMSLEIFNEAYWQRPPLEVAREGFAAMSGIMEAAGFK